MERNLRNIILTGVVGALAVGGIMYEGDIRKIDDSTPYEVCELGGYNGDFNPRAEDVTTRDVHCKRVILPDGTLIIPRKAEELPDYCKGEFMQRGKNWKCEYFPPKYFDI